MQLLKQKPKDKKINIDVNIAVDIILKRMDDIDEKLDLLLNRGSMDTEGVPVSCGNIIKLDR